MCLRPSAQVLNEKRQVRGRRMEEYLVMERGSLVEKAWGGLPQVFDRGSSTLLLNATD